MVKLALPLLLILALSAPAFADDHATMAGEMDRAAQDADAGIRATDEGLEANNRQAKHLGDATATTKAAIDQTEDFRYRDFFSQLIAALNKIISLMLLLVGGGALGAGVFTAVKRFSKGAQAVAAAVTSDDQAPGGARATFHEEQASGASGGASQRKPDPGHGKPDAERHDQGSVNGSNGNGHGLTTEDKHDVEAIAKFLELKKAQKQGARG